MVLTTNSSAQSLKLPRTIDDLFSFQYPYATNVTLAKKGKSIYVDFTMLNECYHAVYERDEWKYSVMNYSFERLPLNVKLGFMNTRFSKSEVSETSVVFLPSNILEYRLRIKQGGLNNRYVFFNENGRPIRYSTFT